MRGSQPGLMLLICPSIDSSRRTISDLSSLMYRISTMRQISFNLCKRWLLWKNSESAHNRRCRFRKFAMYPRIKRQTVRKRDLQRHFAKGMLEKFHLLYLRKTKTLPLSIYPTGWEFNIERQEIVDNSPRACKRRILRGELAI